MPDLTNAEAALLGLLSERPMHPYQIEKEVRSRDMRFWTELSMSSIYKLLRKLEKIQRGRGSLRDLEEIEAWGKTIKAASRCGLGQTSPNPILSTLQNFREMYLAKVRPDAAFVSEFDLERAVGDAVAVTGQKRPAAESDHE